jgi:hypothetical protein
LRPATLNDEVQVLEVLLQSTHDQFWS